MSTVLQATFARLAHVFSSRANNGAKQLQNSQAAVPASHQTWGVKALPSSFLQMSCCYQRQELDKVNRSQSWASWAAPSWKSTCRAEPDAARLP